MFDRIMRFVAGVIVCSILWLPFVLLAVYLPTP
jgi:hypothetical protein